MKCLWISIAVTQKFNHDSPHLPVVEEWTFAECLLDYFQIPALVSLSRLHQYPHGLSSHLSMQDRSSYWSAETCLSGGEMRILYSDSQGFGGPPE